MLADALKPNDGIVMWRAFVYNPSGEDRAKQAYLEFMPLDGKFRDNVLIQVKNGPIDFQPREPFSPLFGYAANCLDARTALPRNILDFQPRVFGYSMEGVFDSDTYCRGVGSTWRDRWGIFCINSLPSLE